MSVSVDLQTWGCCGWFPSMFWGSKSCLCYFLSAGEWERPLPAAIFWRSPRTNLFFNSLVERTVGSELSLWWTAALLCWDNLDAALNKAIKTKIPLQLSLVFNILFIPMLLCFACGKTASKQPPRSEALGG